MAKNFQSRLLRLMLAAWPILAASAAAPEDLERQFQTPPAQARPWVYWVWLDTDIPRPAITRDLEEMKAKGIAGCIHYGNQSGHWAWRGDVVLSGKEYRVVKNRRFPRNSAAPKRTFTSSDRGPRCCRLGWWDRSVC